MENLTENIRQPDERAGCAVAVGSASDVSDANGSLYARLKWWKDQADSDADEIHRLRAALEDIGTLAHCISLAGPANTPDLAAAWSKFDRISAMATNALCPPNT